MGTIILTLRIIYMYTKNKWWRIIKQQNERYKNNISMVCDDAECKFIHVYFSVLIYYIIHFPHTFLKQFVSNSIYSRAMPYKYIHISNMEDLWNITKMETLFIYYMAFKFWLRVKVGCRGTRHIFFFCMYI